VGLEEAKERLTACLHGTVNVEERMSRHTSYRIGGPAALFVTCDDYADVRNTVDILAQEGVPWVIMGRGSNVLVSDEGYRGAVIVLGRDFRRFTVDESGRMHVGAGAVLQRVVTEAFDKGFSGLEFAVGIPGTVGGAVSMNAGTASIWMDSVIAEVVAYRAGTGLVRYAHSDVSWYYRATDLPGTEIILEATLDLHPGDAALVKDTMEKVLQRRRAAQPLNLPSCGSVFRNSADAKAGPLIDACGLKGYRVGNAMVSDMHANFIVNLGGATAADVAQVIVHVMEEVRKRHGVELRPEVKFLGFPA
jgi:UDP-N-acetylmuramate dehydrogenase